MPKTKALVKRDNSANMKPLTKFEVYLAGLPVIEIGSKYFHLDEERNEIRLLSAPAEFRQWKGK